MPSEALAQNDIKITVLKAALALVEHIECFRLVLFHRGNCSLKHGLGFLGKCHIVLPELVRRRQIRGQYESPQMLQAETWSPPIFS